MKVIFLNHGIDLISENAAEVEQLVTLAAAINRTQVLAEPFDLVENDGQRTLNGILEIVQP